MPSQSESGAAASPPVAEPARAVVGIDLGTTNSVIALMADGRAEVLRSPAGEALVPSVVLLDLDERIVVGDDARSALVAMPERTVAAVKRMMGQDTRIHLGPRTFTPEEISALILGQLKRYVEQLYPDGPIEAVITVPAYFNEAQRRATQMAGELAGFTVDRIINEPTAAALAFGFYQLGRGAAAEPSRHLLVYDLGGGTFDVSVLRLTGGILEVLASTGNRQLGGEDFDWKLVDWLASQFIRRGGPDPREEARSRALLKDTAQQVKHQLSQADAAEASVPVLLMDAGRPRALKEPVRRDQFEHLIAPWIDETLAKVDEVLAAARLEAAAIDEVLLVGGSTRIPMVRRRLAERFGRAARSDVDPDLAVALGAAVQAGLKSGQLAESGLVVTDVAPFSMGMAVARPDWRGEWVPGHYHVMIPKNTTVPVTHEDRFATVEDDQKAIAVEIYQGEHPMVARNYALGSLLFDGLPEAPAGEQAIRVKFRYNLNGMLEVTAQSDVTGESVRAVVQDGLERSSQDALAASHTKMAAWLAGEVPDSADPDADDLLDAPEEDWAAAVAQAEQLARRLSERPGARRAGGAVAQALAGLRQAEQSGLVDQLLTAIDEGLDVLLDAGG